MSEYMIYPYPKLTVPRPGMLSIPNGTTIVVDAADGALTDELEATAQAFCALAHEALGFHGEVTTRAENDSNPIRLSIDGAMKAEAYRLDVDDRVTIVGGSRSGVWFALVSLLQLMQSTPRHERPAVAGEPRAFMVPKMNVIDEPRYSWRGSMLDCSRHFFPVAVIKRYLDLLAYHKLNVFHWHLVDDQGWRLEIPKYPRLTEIGAWRPGDSLNGRPYGGFYTASDVGEIVAYAACRGITVVPEIEMPGHSAAALAAYPEFGVAGVEHSVPTTWGIHDKVLAVYKSETEQFMKDVLTEVFRLFPGKYIHLGGDECPREPWETDPACARFMAENDIPDLKTLHGRFMTRMSQFVVDAGRIPIGWDEVCDAPIPTQTWVAAWRRPEFGVAAAKAGHSVVMCPSRVGCYYDYKNFDDPSEPGNLGVCTVDDVGRFDPTDGVPHEFHDLIVGSQGNIWTERIEFGRHLEYMAFPRLSVLADTLWANRHDWNGVGQTRLTGHLAKLTDLTVRYYPGPWERNADSG